MEKTCLIFGLFFLLFALRSFLHALSRTRHREKLGHAGVLRIGRQVLS